MTVLNNILNTICEAALYRSKMNAQEDPIVGNIPIAFELGLILMITYPEYAQALTNQINEDQRRRLEVMSANLTAEYPIEVKTT